MLLQFYDTDLPILFLCFVFLVLYLFVKFIRFAALCSEVEELRQQGKKLQQTVEENRKIAQQERHELFELLKQIINIKK
jgi:Na+-transporting methylmalonyl-CoA/oxaloacetate decarboxylase gamma subunit